jgi:hypothetical protein
MNRWTRVGEIMERAYPSRNEARGGVRMKTRSNRISAVLSAMAVLAAAWLVSAAPASAGHGKLISNVSLNVSHSPTFQGKVSSPDPPTCVRGRTVILYAFGTGGRRYEFGRDRTNARGKWSVSDQLDGATTFQAKVKASTEDGVRCLTDSSKVRAIRP